MFGKFFFDPLGSACFEFRAPNFDIMFLAFLSGRRKPYFSRIDTLPSSEKIDKLPGHLSSLRPLQNSYRLSNGVVKGWRKCRTTHLREVC